MEMTTDEGKGLQRAINIFRDDLNAIPPEAFDKSFGPATRTVADIVFEVNLVNDHVGITVRGEEFFDWPEGWIKAPEDFRTKEVVIAGFERSAEKILATYRPFSAEDLDAKVTNDDGGESTRAERARFMTLHLWYHSGQLNFIQTLLGDDGWHWK